MDHGGSTLIIDHCNKALPFLPVWSKYAENSLKIQFRHPLKSF